MGELAGGGSVAAAVGVSDMQQVAGDMGHMTFDRRDAQYATHVMQLFSYFFVVALLL